MHKKQLGFIVGALILGGIGGYMLHTPPAASVGPQQNRMAGFGGPRMGGSGGFLTGTVATKDASSITLNTRDGSSHIVLFTPATTVSKSVTGAVADVAVGSTVIVSGSTNTDGSVSATLIQLRPASTTQSGQ